MKSVITGKVLTTEGLVQNVSSVGEEFGKLSFDAMVAMNATKATRELARLATNVTLCPTGMPLLCSVLTIRRLRVSTGMSSGLIPAMHPSCVFFSLLRCLFSVWPQSPASPVFAVPVNPTQNWVWSNKGVCTTLLVSKEVCFARNNHKKQWHSFFSKMM